MEELAEQADTNASDTGGIGDTAGSCSYIAEGSTCVEYYGSYWNKETIQMTCGDGVFSEGECPRPTVGGCRMISSPETDMITWHYDHGGDPFTEEVVVYAAQACNAVPGGTWTEE